MSRPTLRIAQPDAAASIDMEEAVMAMVRKVVATGPSVVMVLWETPAPANEGFVTCHMASVPDSLAVRIGLLDLANKELFPDPG